MMMARKRKPWRGSVGHGAHVVHYGERPGKGWRVYLWWLEGQKGERTWKRRSLGFHVRDPQDPSGAILDHRAREAQVAAEAQWARLTGRLVEVAETTAITLGETWGVLTDAARGKYPHDTPYRRELLAALTFAREVKGDEFPWIAFDIATLQEVCRAKVVRVVEAAKAREAAARAEAAAAGEPPPPPSPMIRTGYRSAEVVGTRLITIMTLLRDRDRRIPAQTVVPGGRIWKHEIASFATELYGQELPETHRPRYTQAEIHRLFALCWEPDPRLGLGLTLGAEYRGVQVARARRSHVDLDAESFGTFRIPGKGKKSGELVVLTAGQRAGVLRALAGYLAPLEALRLAKEIDDYPLFPGGALWGRTVQEDGTMWGPPDTLTTGREHATRTPPHKRTWLTWWHELERLAEIAHVPGRAWYGGRRGLLDLGMDEGASEEAMQVGGGWKTARTPKEIYRDKALTKARQEASTIRAKVRGEVSSPPPSAAPSVHAGPEMDPTADARTTTPELTS